MQTSYSTQNLSKIDSARIAIIQSKWHREHTDRMVVKCREVLREAGSLDPEIHIASGSLEIPLMAQRLCRLNRGYEAIIVFGVIIKGDTYHFEMITNECMRGLGQVMLSEDMPIINEILPVTELKHVIERSSDNDKNKGIEAALAAIETIYWRRQCPLK